MKQESNPQSHKLSLTAAGVATGFSFWILIVWLTGLITLTTSMWVELVCLSLSFPIALLVKDRNT